MISFLKFEFTALVSITIAVGTIALPDNLVQHMLRLGVAIEVLRGGRWVQKGCLASIAALIRLRCVDRHRVRIYSKFLLLLLLLQLCLLVMTTTACVVSVRSSHSHLFSSVITKIIK